MEKLLLKMADQLDSLPEAPLMDLWNKYARQTCTFSPTREWERAALVLCLIQAKRMKNQLFNYCWSAVAKDAGEDPRAEQIREMQEMLQETVRREPCPVLQFKPLPDDDDK